jgi:hypothetical protein
LLEDSKLQPSILDTRVTPDGSAGLVIIQLGIPLDHAARPHLDAIEGGIIGVSSLSILSVKDRTLIMECQDVTDSEELHILYVQCISDLYQWYLELSDEQRAILIVHHDPLEALGVYSAAGPVQRRSLDYDPEY